MITTKKYISYLAGLLFLLTFLMTGCVKDDSISPISEDATFKSMQSYDAQMQDGRSGDDDTTIGGGDDDGDITDDEDDEDDTDRSKH